MVFSSSNWTFDKLTFFITSEASFKEGSMRILFHTMKQNGVIAYFDSHYDEKYAIVQW